MNSPFKFLDAYSLEDRKHFFGRKKEIQELYSKIFKTSLLLVYGDSGTGKTSLIQCGLASEFDGPDWYPIFIRRQKKDINLSIQQSMQSATKGNNFDTLSESVQYLYRYYLRPVYLIFDQFEEIFTDHPDKDEQEKFLKDLKELLDAQIPCKIILIIREEYIGQLYDFEQAIPNIFDFRVRVEPMGLKKVTEVLKSSFKEFKISIKEEYIKKIVENVSGGKSLVQLPYLQVYLDMLYQEDFKRDYPDKTFQNSEELLPLTFTKEEIDNFGKIENVLEKFLFDEKRALQLSLDNKNPGQGKLINALLDLFVTEKGTKKPVFYTLKDGKIKLEQSFLSSLSLFPESAIIESIQNLAKRRILRITDEHIELAHDSLAKLINKQRTDQQRQLSEIKRRLKSNYQEHQETGEYLSRKQLNIYEDFVPLLGLGKDDPLQAFITNSTEYQENKEWRQLVKWISIAAIFGVIAIIAGISSFNAREQKKIAVTEKKNAEYKTRELETTLAKLSEAREKMASDLVKEANSSIYAVNYTKALKKTQDAILIDSSNSSISNLLQEIAFFYSESGQQDTALLALSSIPSLNPIKEDLNQQIKAVDPIFYDTLQNRYYPEMLNVPAGRFQMGCKTASNCEADELPLHHLNISQFEIAATEITFWQLALFCKSDNLSVKDFAPSWGLMGDNPAVNIRWSDANDYAKWLSQKQSQTYHLPYEAEWEYAARGGNKNESFKYAGSNKFTDVGWNRTNSPVNGAKRTHKIKEKQGNSLGLFDMTGNAMEWCLDSYANNYYQNSPSSNPQGPKSSDTKVLRGGSYDSDLKSCRVSNRYTESRNYRNSRVGFRLVRK